MSMIIDQHKYNACVRTAISVHVNKARIIYVLSTLTSQGNCMVEAAELFEAISHPIRIRILKILRNQPASFASLKRQLDIDSSGNIDHHLKKLGQLIAVQKDGLYGLTDVGKEALLSIETIEVWSEMEKRKIKTFEKAANEVVVLALAEIFTACASTFWLFWMFTSTFQTPELIYSLLSPVIVFLGFSSAFGILTCKRWSWNAVLAKSALMMLGSLGPLYYLSLLLQEIAAMRDVSRQVVQFYPIGIFYAMFVIAEVFIVYVALRRSVMDFLGIKPIVWVIRALLGGVAGIIGGVSMVIFANVQMFPSFSALEDPSHLVLGPVIFLSGLVVGIGGLLILLRNYTLGSQMSVIFGLPFPVYFFADQVASGAPVLTLYPEITVAILIGSLSIVGGVLGLLSKPKTLE